MFVFGTIGGTATNNDHVQITITGSTLTGSPLTIDYTVTGVDTPTSIATELVDLINNDLDLQAASISAQVFGPKFVIEYPEQDIFLFTKAVVGAGTETITLYDFLTLFWGSETSFFDFLNQIDARLPIIGDGPPTTVVPRQPGVFYYDRLNLDTYRADYTDGLTIAGTSWSIQNFSLPVADTTTQGIVELATDAETAAGLDQTRATTPYGVASAFARLGSNSDITQLNSLQKRGDFAGGRGPWDNLSEATLALLPTQTLKGGRSLVTDGSNNLSWGTRNAWLGIEFPTVTSTQLKIGYLYILNTNSLTLLLPTIAGGIEVGEILGFTPGNVTSITFHCNDGSKIMNSLQDFIINEPYSPPFCLAWSGATYGWVISP